MYSIGVDFHNSHMTVVDAQGQVLKAARFRILKRPSTRSLYPIATMPRPSLKPRGTRRLCTTY
jgi:hypothetical protein